MIVQTTDFLRGASPKEDSDDEDGGNSFLTIPIRRAHKFYLTGRIREAEHYVRWIEHIRSAPAEDVIVLYINSIGGDGFTAIQLLRALSETNATTVASVEGACMSAATFLFLAAKHHEVTDHSVFLFHNYSGIQMGKGGEMFDSISHDREWSRKLLTDVYSGFLTPEEIDGVLNDKNMWMASEEVVARLAKRDEFLRKKQEAPTAIVEPPKKRRSKKIPGV